MADCFHLSVRVSTHLDPKTTPTSVGGLFRMSLPLSRTLSQPEEIGQHALPAAVDSGGVAQKEQFQFREQGRGRGKPWSNCFSMLSVVCQGHRS